jgi:4-aminobutyrate aminotransferase and related aminotransferases
MPARARAIGERLTSRLRAMETPQFAEVRGRGAMVAVEITRPGTLEPDAAETQRIARECAAQGVLVLTCGTFGNVLRFLPPLVIGDDLLDEALDVIASVVRAGAA